MRNSLSLYLYRLNAAKRSNGADPLLEDFADPVVWIVAHDTATVRAFINIGKKLDQAGLCVTLLVTGPESVIDEFQSEAGIVFSSNPPESSKDCRAFVEHWKPIICFWDGEILY